MGSAIYNRKDVPGVRLKLSYYHQRARSNKTWLRAGYFEDHLRVAVFPRCGYPPRRQDFSGRSSARNLCRYRYDTGRQGGLPYKGRDASVYSRVRKVFAPLHSNGYHLRPHPTTFSNKSKTAEISEIY
ncbi:hypothetical protein C7212DRAFT_342449 [Tuber magnatum]|uniref:Uncharacterized protein n=1 Tax=Tuber magnatum TaxID=42249 RepID=A0A317SX96_9PEZI|nr:hypothetical protein C7212DRAFT_342449 [Tuber magnatum]